MADKKGKGAVEPISPVEGETDGIDLAALGITSSDDVLADAFARVLVLGPPKSGKTSAIAATASDPLVINCDGYGATQGAARIARTAGRKFLTLDVEDGHSLKSAISTAEALAQKGIVKTVILDTLSLLVPTLVEEASLTLKNWDIWNDVHDRVIGALRRLMMIQAHLFVISHMTADTGDDNPGGILPYIPGKKLKVEIPALIADWIMLDVDPDRTPQRQFLLGPQKYWTASGRHVSRTCAIEATVPALLAELGIPE